MVGYPAENESSTGYSLFFDIRPFFHYDLGGVFKG
jgi:hypothetical protein